MFVRISRKWLFSPGSFVRNSLSPLNIFLETLCTYLVCLCRAFCALAFGLERPRYGARRLAIRVCMLPNRLMEFAIASALLIQKRMPESTHERATANDRFWFSHAGNLHCRVAENVSVSILDAIFPRSAGIRKLAGTGVAGARRPSLLKSAFACAALPWVRKMRHQGSEWRE